MGKHTWTDQENQMLRNMCEDENDDPYSYEREFNRPILAISNHAESLGLTANHILSKRDWKAKAKIEGSSINAKKAGNLQKKRILPLKKATDEGAGQLTPATCSELVKFLRFALQGYAVEAMVALNGMLLIAIKVNEES